MDRLVGDEPSDVALLERIASGDWTAFGVLVRRHVRAATLAAEQFVHDPEEAEDVAEDAFLVVRRRAGEFDATRPFGPWLFGIVRALAQNRRRRVARRLALLRRWSGSSPAAPSPAAQVEARDALARVHAAIEHLPDMQRRCIALHAVRGFEVREVASMLGLSESTVRQHIFRARRALAPLRADGPGA